MKLYLAGPMRGLPEHNFPAFHEAAKGLRDQGHEVWSPAEHDLSEGFDPVNDKPLPLSHYMTHDLPAVCQSDAVACLHGWEKSDGAKLEVYVAQKCGKPVFKVTPEITLESISEARQIDPDTGGEKGVKPERFELLPWEELSEIARVYGYGANKYAPDNWKKGYAWSQNYGALIRHARAWWLGEERDSESGLHHLAHCSWHCLTLMWFNKHKPNKDDRPKESVNEKS